MMEGLLVKYNKARKVSKALTEFHRTGKTKEEREQKPIDDGRLGALTLYVVSSDINYKPELPLVGSVVLPTKVSDSEVLYKLLYKSPTRLFYLDVETGKQILGDAYGSELAKAQLADVGVGVNDTNTVLESMADDAVPAYFNKPLLVDILSSAGFAGFVYTSPFDRSAFVLWDGLEDVLVLAYSLDGGSTWIDV